MFSHNGIIDRNGQWISCQVNQHIATIMANSGNGPFVECRQGSIAEFAAYYTVDKINPTQAQFETLMDWCTAMEITFESAVDCWNLPWQDWLIVV